jgi:hypothetical protein
MKLLIGSVTLDGSKGKLIYMYEDLGKNSSPSYKRQLNDAVV